MQSGNSPVYEPSLRYDLRKIQIITLLSIVAIQTFLVIVFAYEGILWVIGPLLGIFFLVYTALSVEKVFFFLLFYIVVFEEFYYAGRFAGLPIYFSWPVVTILFAVLVVYWGIHLARTRYTFAFKTLDLVIIVFLFFVLLAALNGYLRGYDGKSWRWDVLPYPFYLAYFIFIYSNLRKKTNALYTAILILCIPVAFEMIYALIQSRGAILFQRIVTQNIHLMQFAIPYAGLVAIFSESRNWKLIGGILLPVFVFAVVISQQRALMFSVFITLFILLFIYLRVRFQSARERLRFLGTRSLIIIAIILIPFVFIEIFTKESLFLTFFSRFYIFLNPLNLLRDSSWQIRWQEITRAMPLIKENIIIGAGLGATTISRHRMILQITLDNSYIYILWKMGVFGLISFLSIYYIVIKRCALIIRSTKNNHEKIFSGAVLLNVIGLLIVGMTNVCIAHYRFIFAWLTLIASIELIARKYD